MAAPSVDLTPIHSKTISGGRPVIDLTASAGSFFGRIDDCACAEFHRELGAAGREFRHDDRAGALGLGPYQGGKADRPRAHHDYSHARFDRRVIHAVEADRERLDQRAGAGADVGGEFEQARGAACDELGVSAGELAESEAAELGTMHRVVARAPCAYAARDVRQRGDAIADAVAVDVGAERMNLAAEFMAHHGVRRHPDAVLDGVKIGAADSAVVHLEHDFADARDRIGHVDDGHLVFFLEHRCFHSNQPFLSRCGRTRTYFCCISSIL